jgi:hypothetical protein
MANLYRVRMWLKSELSDLVPTTEVVIQLTTLEDVWVLDGHAGSFPYANVELLKIIEGRGERFVGSLPDFDPIPSPSEKGKICDSFWIITEPVVQSVKLPAEDLTALTLPGRSRTGMIDG